MYKRQRQGLYKHWDIILIDIIFLQISFIIAYMIRHKYSLPYGNSDYNSIAAILVLTDLCLAIMGKGYRKILKRSPYKEFEECVKRTSIIMAAIVVYMFLTKKSDTYSREVMLMTWVIGTGLGFLVRIIWKGYLKYSRGRKKERVARSVLLVTSRRRARQIVQSFKEQHYRDFYLSGIVFTNQEASNKYIEDIPVVTTLDDLYEYVKCHVVDEVFISFDNNEILDKCMIAKLLEAGITVHTDLSRCQIPASKNIVEGFGGYTVITSSINMVSMKDILIKRLFDIIISLFGIAAMVVFIFLIAPIVMLQSPGPIFFSQIRIGKSGRKFKIYKFRTMYLDAEERKKELMKRNRIKDGMMFKIENDPRIFPFGHIMRKFSIDEIPQFINVLKGDMSLVGTRPPTVDEYEKYELAHKSRLAVKPGITGMWQVKGRSSILNFEDVVKLDNEYIKNWSIGLDLQIIFETFKVVILGKGAM